MRSMRIILALAAAAFAMSVVAPVATAHYKTGNPDDPDSVWYFRGQTWAEDKPIDPVNFMFYGGTKDDSDYSRDRIETHMRDDWDTRVVGGRRWRKDGDIRFYCKGDQRMRWVNYPGETSDKTDWHGTTARFPGFCGNQHHARFWDDLEHSRETAHGRTGQWAVGGIHHEKVVARFVALGHKPDRDWDVVRYEMVRAMKRHCSSPLWKYHPGADAQFQNYDNSGYVARLSLHHVEDGGCDGW